jgi:organic radical activating enzyme
MNQPTKEKEFLIVSEKFTSIQGEGQTMGKNSIFLRLSGCNILCQSESWICDTIEVWRKGKKTAFENIFNLGEIDRLKNGFHLIITGGEPLLHQNKVSEFLYYFTETHGFTPIIEVETNGTIEPNAFLLAVVKYWNVSPKLQNSGVSKLERFKPEVLEIFNQFNSIFKFVVSNEEDMDEISNLLTYIHKNKIWLMPAGSDREQLDKSRPIVIQQCLNYGLSYSERLHIIIWNQKTGV